jgi:hypothetical protein
MNKRKIGTTYNLKFTTAHAFIRRVLKINIQTHKYLKITTVFFWGEGGGGTHLPVYLPIFVGVISHISQFFWPFFPIFKDCCP